MSGYHQLPRPGGRTARVRAAVLEAAFTILVERGISGLNVAAVSAASGVHETTIYRRWANLAGLALEACVEHVSVEIPTPDTGSLRSDLVCLVQDIVNLLGRPSGRALLNVLQSNDDGSVNARAEFWAARFGAAHVIFERAAARGEWSMDFDQKIFLELLIAPIYLRALVTNQPLAELPIESIVDMLLSIDSFRRQSGKGSKRRQFKHPNGATQVRRAVVKRDP